MPRPSIAYLVLAHNQPEHVLRLIRAIRDPKAFVFVHVDAKADITQFEALRNEPRLAFVAEREHVYWGGFSQVRATLNLLHAAVGSGQPFARFTLLSGADFPIKGKEEISEILLASDREFMRIDRKLHGQPRNEHFKYIERIYWNDKPWFNRRERTRFPALRYPVMRSFELARRLLPARTFVGGLTPYHGSQWWSLTAGCVRHLLDYLARNPEFERFHRTVLIPDEIFFHSLVKASPFALKISQDFEAGPSGGNEYGLHYIDWNATGVSLPKVLEESDLPALVSSRALFARKFATQQSGRLIEALVARYSLGGCEEEGAGNPAGFRSVPHAPVR